MIGQIVPATLEHAIAMAPRVRKAEQLEVADSHGMPMVQALRRDLEASISAWSWLVDGEPACMFGLVPSRTALGSAFPWFLSTDVVEKHAGYFARGCRTGLAEMLERHPRLFGMVDARYALSIRWLLWMGARVGEPRPWGVAGELFRPFEFGGA